MPHVRKVPHGNVKQLAPVLGLFALPVAVFQNSLALLAEMSCMWSNLLFKPHENPTESGHQLTVPEPLAKDMDHDLFA